MPISFLLFNLPSLILILGSLFIYFLPASLLSYSHQGFITFGSLLAMSIYQPHFLVTYYFNYSRGWSYLKKHWFIFLLFPALFFLFILILFLTQTTQSFTLALISILLLFTGYHFSSQTMSACQFENQTAITPPAIFFRIGKIILISFYLIGLFKFISFNQNIFDFYGTQVNFFNLNQNILNVFIYFLLFFEIFFIYKWKNLGLRFWLPFVCFSSLFLVDNLIREYFYLIAIVHALQYLPFYFRRTQPMSKKFHLYVILLSLGFIFLLPNLLEYKWGYKNSWSQLHIFNSILIFFNLHHFLMETKTWKKTLDDIDIPQIVNQEPHAIVQIKIL